MNRLYHQLFMRIQPTDQNQIQSQDELTNTNPSKTMDTSENDNISIGSECVAKKRSKIRKRIKSVYEDQHINGDEMPIDSSKSQRRPLRELKTVDTLSPLKNHHQSMKGKKSNLQSKMSTLACIMQMLTLCE